MSKLKRPAIHQRFIGRCVEVGLLVCGWVALRLRRSQSGGIDLTTQAPLVSVLIPTHNRSELLITRSLRSVLAQTYDNLEVIVCAHGCTDDTVKRVAGLGDARVRVLIVPRHRLGYPATAANHWLVGPVRPLNAGTKSAKGQIIALLGDDDEWVPDHLEHSISLLRRSPAEWVSGWSTDIDAGGQSTTNRGDKEGDQMVGPVATWVYVAYLGFAKWNIHSWRKGWDRPNDIDLAKRFLRMGVRHANVSRVGAIWQTRPGEGLLGVAAYMENPEMMLDKFSVKAPFPGKKSKED